MRSDSRHSVVAVPRANNYYPWQRAPQWFEFGCFTLRSVSFWTPVLLAVGTHALALYISADWLVGFFDFFSLEELLQSFAASAGGPPHTWQQHQILSLGSFTLPSLLICAGLTVLFAATAAAVVAYRAKYEKPLAAHWIFILVLGGTVGVCTFGTVVAVQSWRARELLRSHYERCPSETWTTAACEIYQTWAGAQEGRFFALLATGVVASCICAVLLALLSVVVGRAFLCAPFEYPDIVQRAVSCGTREAVTMMPYSIRTAQQQAVALPVTGGRLYSTYAHELLPPRENYTGRINGPADRSGQQYVTEVFPRDAATVTSCW